VNGAGKTDDEEEVEYSGEFYAGGFLTALAGNWEGSNGSASGTLEGVSANVILVQGTARVTIRGVALESAKAWARIGGNTDDGSSTWRVSEGPYAGEEIELIFGPSGGGAECFVNMERLAVNKFRFVYDWSNEGGGSETMEITLNENKKEGSLTFTRENIEITVSGGFDITKKD
jgi:hypothetical protein